MREGESVPLLFFHSQKTYNKVMKTLIELYDENQVLNLYSAYALKPETVIFLYTEEQENIIDHPVLRKYISGKTEYRKYEIGSLDEAIRSCLSDDCAVDILGGGDLAIASAAMYAVHSGIRLVCPDVKTKKMQVLSGGKYTLNDMDVPPLSIRDIVELHGGGIRDLEEIEYDEAGRRAVDAVNRVKRANDGRWSSFTKVMGGLYKKYGKHAPWKAEASVYNEYRSLLNGLMGEVFSTCEVRDNRLYIEFKNSDYMILLADAGVPFEYDTYYQMLDSGWFDDLDIRVNIDWNGGGFEHNDPNSELDVMASKDSRLISVSCKAGKYDQQAIYEVKANAVRFGGEEAVAVLCVDHHTDHPEYVLKAEELGVLLIEHTDMWEGRCAERIRAWFEEH